MSSFKELRIGNNCILAGQVGIIGHIKIADNVIILARSGVGKSIKVAGYYFGAPAKEIKTAYRIEAHIKNLPGSIKRIDEIEKEIKKLKEQFGNKQ